MTIDLSWVGCLQARGWAGGTVGDAWRLAAAAGAPILVLGILRLALAARIPEPALPGAWPIAAFAFAMPGVLEVAARSRAYAFLAANDPALAPR